MKVTRFNGLDERRILTAMITNDVAVRQIAQHWRKPGLFLSSWANLVGNWCVDYADKYNKAPRRHIKDLFKEWAENGADQDQVKVINKFLVSLSDDYDENDAQYVIDAAAKHFNRSAMVKLAQNLQESLEVGHDVKAIELLQDFRTITLGGSTGIDPFQDVGAIQETIEAQENETLITWPGDLGSFLRNQFARDSFIAFMGPDKRGKSFWLLDVAFRAAIQRRKIAYFVIGDMSQRQAHRRIITRTCKRPLYAGAFRKPIAIRPPKTGHICQIKSEVISYEKNVSSKKAIERCKRLMQHQIRSKQSYLWLSVHPSMMVSVADLKAALKDREYSSDWIPDVIVIDYADNLRSSHPRLDYREQIGHTWAELRQLSQEYHCCLVTATQSDADAYKKTLLRRQNFSDSKKKLAHVTGMLGINVTDEEKAKQVTRLNWLELRDAPFTESEVVFVAGCAAIANPALLSCTKRAANAES